MLRIICSGEIHGTLLGSDTYVTISACGMILRLYIIHILFLCIAGQFPNTLYLRLPKSQIMLLTEISTLCETLKLKLEYDEDVYNRV